jgi:hypothetical protein
MRLLEHQRPYTPATSAYFPQVIRVRKCARKTFVFVRDKRFLLGVIMLVTKFGLIRIASPYFTSAKKNSCRDNASDAN